MNVQQVFSDDLFQHYTQFTDQDYDPQQISRHSSSSTSLRSLSIGSPEYSSLPVITPNELFISTDQSIAQYQHLLHFPAQPHDDSAITRAIMDIISSTSNPSYQQLDNIDQQMYSMTSYNSFNYGSGAFMQYNSALTPRTTSSERGLSGQKLIKKGIDILKGINSDKNGARPMSNQLHHMISERKRREKLNESFLALRTLLPSGTKKDKVSVLVNAKNYLTSLKGRIDELKERNRMLEMQLHSVDEFEDVQDSNEAVEVQVTNGDSNHMSEVREIELRITVRRECELIDLVLKIRECLKYSGFTNLVSVEGNSVLQMNAFSRLNFKLLVKAIDWDKEAFKEAVIRSVYDLIQ